MSKSQLFVKYHWNQIIVVFVLAVAAVTLNVANDEGWLKKKTGGAVLGETASSGEQKNEEENNQAVMAYQVALKKELGEYLSQRAGLENDPEKWLQLINDSQTKILGLGVPNEYKDLHLKVVTNLDLEEAGVRENDGDKKESANDVWDKILKQFFWLNN